MRVLIELDPEQLAQIVTDVFRANGYHAELLSLYDDKELVGYDRAVLTCEIEGDIQVPKATHQPTDEQLERMLYPNGRHKKSAAATG